MRDTVGDVRLLLTRASLAQDTEFNVHCAEYGITPDQRTKLLDGYARWHTGSANPMSLQWSKNRFLSALVKYLLFQEYYRKQSGPPTYKDVTDGMAEGAQPHQ